MADREQDLEHPVKDRSRKVRGRRSRMPVQGASLKNPDVARVLLSGRRKKRQPPKG